MSIAVKGTDVFIDISEKMDAFEARRLARELSNAADMADRNAACMPATQAGPPPVKGWDDDDDAEPYDDSKDHTPCPECGHTAHPGKDVVNLMDDCPMCDGAGWI